MRIRHDARRDHRRHGFDAAGSRSAPVASGHQRDRVDPNAGVSIGTADGAEQNARLPVGIGRGTIDVELARHDPSASAGGPTGLQDQLNSSLDGQYLFSGTNSDVKPMEDFFANPPPASAQSITNAFVAKFGISPTDPTVSSISPSDMQDFLDNEFSNHFSDANWTSNWSAASDKAVSSRISRTEIADTSVTANNDALRKLTEAYTMVAGLGFANLNAATQQVIVEAATRLAANAIGQLTQVQSLLGVTQQRVSDINDQIDTQVSFLTKSIDNLESVDPTQVTTQISTLTTQLEAAYSVTNRLSNLSIMTYLTRNDEAFLTANYGKAKMYKFSYEETLSDAGSRHRENERLALEQSVELLRSAEKAGPNSREAIDAIFFINRLWSYLARGSWRSRAMRFPMRFAPILFRSASGCCVRQKPSAMENREISRG